MFDVDLKEHADIKDLRNEIHKEFISNIVKKNEMEITRIIQESGLLLNYD